MVSKVLSLYTLQDLNYELLISEQIQNQVPLVKAKATSKTQQLSSINTEINIFLNARAVDFQLILVNRQRL